MDMSRWQLSFLFFGKIWSIFAGRIIDTDFMTWICKKIPRNIVFLCIFLLPFCDPWESEMVPLFCPKLVDSHYVKWRKKGVSFSKWRWQGQWWRLSGATRLEETVKARPVSVHSRRLQASPSCLKVTWIIQCWWKFSCYKRIQIVLIYSYVVFQVPVMIRSTVIHLQLKYLSLIPAEINLSHAQICKNCSSLQSDYSS